MGNNYSKAEKRQIVKDLYKYLHECAKSACHCEQLFTVTGTNG